MKNLSKNPMFVLASSAAGLLSLVLQLSLTGLLAAFVFGVMVGALGLFALTRAG